MTAILYKLTVLPFYIFGSPAAVLYVIKRAEAEEAVDVFKLVTGIIFAVFVFKIRKAHYFKSTTTLR